MLNPKQKKNYIQVIYLGVKEKYNGFQNNFGSTVLKSQETIETMSMVSKEPSHPEKTISPPILFICEMTPLAGVNCLSKIFPFCFPKVGNYQSPLMTPSTLCGCFYMKKKRLVNLVAG